MGISALGTSKYAMCYAKSLIKIDVFLLRISMRGKV